MSDKNVRVWGDLSDTPHGRISDLLHARGVKPGDLVPTEAELSESLSMGRPQVREGLRVLDALGALSSRQGARRVWVGYDPGTLVAVGAALGRADESTVAALLEVRHALETSLLPAVASRIAASELTELRALGDRMVELARAGRPFSDLDAQYHRRLFASLENSVLDGILRAFWVQFDSARPDEASIDPEVAHMHVRIVDALESGDQRLAVHILDAHFYGVRRSLTNA